MKYKVGKRSNRVPKRIWILLAAAVILMAGGTIAARNLYDQGLKPVSASPKTQIFVVERGSTVKQISAKLEKDQLIRSAWAFQLYIHSKNLGDKLQAGTYAFSQSQGVKSIVQTLTRGQVATKLVTILPARRIDQIRADLINEGFKPAEVDQALDPGLYVDLPVLAFKPADVNTLEGLLWPESFQKDATTTASSIIRQSLVAMGEHLTPDVQAAFAAQGLTTYDGVKVASIVLKEVGKPDDQTQAAQVFLTRLKTGMLLQSDASAKYGAIKDGRTPSLSYDSAYNSYIHNGLPPTPISNVTASSLAAATHPAATNWLYFVSGDDGITRFSSTLEEHERLTRQYCHENCGN